MYKTFERDEDFEITWDEIDGELWVHLRLHKASRSILLKVLEAWARFKAHAYFGGYEAVYSYTNDKRILQYFPGSIVIDTIENDIEVVKWDLL